QEVDILSMTLGITKWNYQIMHTAEIKTAVARAFMIAKQGRPGPVLLDITKDAQTQFVGERDHPCMLKHAGLKKNIVDDATITEAATLINHAKRPYLLIGHGVLIAKAEDLLLEFATKAQIPVACTLLGLSAFPSDHPLTVGLLGMHGNYAANLMTNE